MKNHPNENQIFAQTQKPPFLVCKDASLIFLLDRGKTVECFSHKYRRVQYTKEAVIHVELMFKNNALTKTLIF